jgi:twitching motility protein PilT
MLATLPQLLELLVANEASDLHLVSGYPPMVRIHGHLRGVQGQSNLQPSDVHDYALTLMNERLLKIFEERKEVDFAYQFETRARFRVNVYTQQGATAVALRMIPLRIKTIDELGLPPICHELIKTGMGLVLLTGPTGTGKSSSLAAMLQEINTQRAEHILTIEDPVEFVYTPDKAIISQREIGEDTLSWDNALRSALREDPDIVLVGEMRDRETIASALTVAETGHLVFATLHTNSGPETIDRIIDVFPEHQQAQVRQQLSSSLKAVLSQRLIPKVSGDGRVAVMEVMINTPAVANLIREGKTYQIESVMQTSADVGMSTLETNLVQFVQSGIISYDEALKHSIRPNELNRLMGRV